MILSIVIGVLIALILVLGYVVRNILKKNEKQEDILVSYFTYLDRISRVIELSDAKLKEVDHKGSFESDDEVGFFFSQIQQLQDILNEFSIKEIKPLKNYQENSGNKPKPSNDPSHPKPLDHNIEHTYPQHKGQS